MEVLVFFIILIAAFAATFCVLFQTQVFPDKSDYYPYRVSSYDDHRNICIFYVGKISSRAKNDFE